MIALVSVGERARRRATLGVACDPWFALPTRRQGLHIIRQFQTETLPDGSIAGMYAAGLLLLDRHRLGDEGGADALAALRGLLDQQDIVRRRQVDRRLAHRAGHGAPAQQ